MKQKTKIGMLTGFATASLLTFSSSVSAMTLVEPDNFADGTDISSAFTGVTLSTAAGGSVFARNSSIASTGTNVFSPDAGTGDVAGDEWDNDSDVLVATFASPTDFVSLDFISDDSDDVGFLSVFGQSGNLLTTLTTASLAFPSVETLSFSGSIGSITAGAGDGCCLNLDNLQFGTSTPAAVPTPALLPGLAGMGVAAVRKRSQQGVDDSSAS